jgi:hypothetical protein
LRKLNDTIETINGAYKESKDLLISKTIDPANYKENLSRIRENLLKIKKFFFASISETQQAQSAIRVLAKNRPLMGYLMKRLPSHKYGRRFEAKRKNELKIMLREMDEIKKEGKSKIDAIFEDDRSDK